MLNLWRRHTRKCPNDSRDAMRCQCPIWIDWSLPNGQRIRKPLGLRDWQAAQRRARDMESEGMTAATTPKTIEDVINEFIKDAQARDLKEASIRKYKTVFRALGEYCKTEGLVFIGQLNEAHVRAFRNSWSFSPRTAGKYLVWMKTFFRFCQDVKYIKENPAERLKAPRVGDAPVIPFTEEQVKSILAACDRYRGDGKRLRALTELMLATGLRIGDACTISRDKIIHDKDGYSVQLHTAKTGEKVHCPIQDSVGRMLTALPGKHPFWTGKSNAEDCASSWRKAYMKLFKLAGVKGHCHMFRHTFATRLLLKGVSIDVVSVMLSHASVRITEKHYAAFTRERRDAVQKAITLTWAESGTPTAHKRRYR